jgi:hypothetical protein
LIISHKHRFIFIKSRKTAGTSLELALSTICGAKDVITPLHERHDIERARIGGLAPQRTDVPLRRHRPGDWALILRGKGRRAFWAHASAKDIKSWVGPSTWNRYYKFSIERNPWDRAISLYWWTVRDQKQKPSMQEFFDSVPQGILSNLQFYTIDGEIVLDHVIRYENLADEIACLSRRIGLDSLLKLPRAKSNTRTDRRPYREVLGPTERSIIAARCSREIDLFDYEF